MKAIEKNDKDFLANFTKSYTDMVATSEASYNNRWSSFGRIQKKYTIKEIENILERGSQRSQIELSRYFFSQTGIYSRILLHYATLLKYVGLLIPNPSFGKSLSEPYIFRKYDNAADFIDQIQLKNIYTKIALAVLRDGSYYGVVQSITKKTLSLIDLPIFYCRTNFKDLAGRDIIEFNVEYFDSIRDEKARKSALQTYPKEISDWYRQYKKGTVKSWMIIPPEIGICIPFFEGNPLFLKVIPAAIEYDQAKEINKERDLEEIRKIIVQQIPHNNEGQLLFEPVEAARMHEGTVKMMGKNSNISVLTTYADVNSIVSKTSNDNSISSVDKALNNIYAEGGVSPQLFGTNSNLSLSTSIENDMALMLVLAQTLDGFISSILNNNFGNSNISFKYTTLPVTHYNEGEYIDRTLKMATSGYSFLLPALAIGLSQKELGNIKDLENNVLKLKEKLIPLSTSFTESGNVGRPEKSNEEKSEKTVANQESLDGGGTNE